MNDFKPCPYCGDKCVMSFERGEFKLRCYNCHAKMEWFTNEDEAMEAWNKRDCNCDELSYFENGVELALNVLERVKSDAEKAGGKDCAAYLIISRIIEEIENQAENAVNP